MPVIPSAAGAPVIPSPNAGPTRSGADLLDLIIGQRESTFEFALLDRDLLPIGILDVSAESVPHIDNQVDRTVKRTLDNVQLLPTTAADVNPQTDRMEVTMILSDGSRWPLGVFLFSANNRPVFGWGSPLLPSFGDQTTILAQPTAVPISVRPGSRIIDVLVERLSNYRLPRGVVMDDTDATTGTKAPMVWPPGTLEVEILDAVAKVAGFNSGYFDNTGIYTIAAPRGTGAGAGADHFYDYDANQRIISDTLVYSDDLLDQPNRWLVIDSSATDNAIYASYDLPAADPSSASSRGFVQTAVLTPQSVGSIANAHALAMKAGKAARTTESVTFSSPLDPRHDTFDTVQVLDKVYREQQWSLPLKEGQPMTHQAHRSYE